MRQFSSVLLGMSLALAVPAAVCCDSLGGQPDDIIDSVISLVDSTQTSVTLPAEGGQVFISFNTSYSWEASSNAVWLKVSPESGNASGSISVSAEANTSGAPREARIFISLNGSDVSLTLKASQDTVSAGPGPGPGPDPKGLVLEASIGGWNAGSTVDFTYEKVGSEGWTERGKVLVEQPWWLGYDENGRTYIESSVLLTKALDSENLLCCIPDIFADDYTLPSDMYFIWNTSSNWIDLPAFPIGYYYSTELGTASQLYVADHYNFLSSLKGYEGVWESADDFYSSEPVLRCKYSDGSFLFCCQFFIPSYGRFNCPYDEYIITATLTR